MAGNRNICWRCGKFFWLAWLDHLKLHNESQEFSCPYCATPQHGNVQVIVLTRELGRQASAAAARFFLDIMLPHAVTCLHTLRHSERGEA